MSLTSSTSVNPNTFIARLYDMLTHSPYIFPKTIGGNQQAQDLVQQIIQYELPIPEAPREGGGPPHVYITLSKQQNPIFRNPLGRSNINQQGPEEQTWEFYIIVVHHDVDYHTTEHNLNNLCQAITETLDLNKRMLDDTGANPICAKLEWILVPFLLDTDERDVLAKNIVVRPHVFVNMRTS